MPTIPQKVVLTNSSYDVLNAIRNSASQNYKDYVPIATEGGESIKEIGAVIMDYPNLQNEFLNTLVNRIALVLINSLNFDNPYAIFKRGFLEFGETVEELYVDIATPQEYDPEVAEAELYQRVIPKVRSSFHPMNYQKFYKITVQQRDLKLAFVSEQGVQDLVSKIVNSLYTAMEYDEFLTTRYLLARRLLDNKFYYIESQGAITQDNARLTLTELRAVSNLMRFPSKEYNVAGVLTASPVDRQYIIVDSTFDANVDVNALAYAFHMEKADYIARRILVPHFAFSASELERLDVLFAAQELNGSYRKITPEQNEALMGVHALLLDRDYFMIFDELQEMRDRANEQGLYWNYFLHTWKTFSVSPFANAVALVDTTVYNAKGAVVTPTYVLTDKDGNTATDVELNTTYYIANATEGTGLPTALTIRNVEVTAGEAVIGMNNQAVTPTAVGTLTLTITWDNGTEEGETATLTVTVTDPTP